MPDISQWFKKKNEQRKAWFKEKNEQRKAKNAEEKKRKEELRKKKEEEKERKRKEKEELKKKKEEEKKKKKEELKKRKEEEKRKKKEEKERLKLEKQRKKLHKELKKEITKREKEKKKQEKEKLNLQKKKEAEERKKKKKFFESLKNKKKRLHKDLKKEIAKREKEKKKQDNKVGLFDKASQWIKKQIKEKQEERKKIKERKEEKKRNDPIAEITDKLVLANKTLSSKLLISGLLSLPLASIAKTVIKYKPDSPDTPEEKAIKENPALLLRNEEFQKLATNKKFWQNIIDLKSKVANRVISGLELKQSKESLTPQVENFINDIGKLFLNDKLMLDILQDAATLADPNEKDPNKKMESLVNILNNSGDIVKLVTAPELWQLINNKKQDIANLAVTALKIPEEQKQEATKLFEDLVETISLVSQEQNREQIQNMVKGLTVLVDPKQNDVTKISQSFELLDQVIQFVESNKNTLQSLQTHKETITKILEPNMPPGIKAETIVNDFLLNENTLNTFKTAYNQYKDNKYHAVGVIKAIATIAKSSEVRNLVTTVALNWVVSIMPNFIRKSYVNKNLDSLLANRNKQEKDLAKLCTVTSTDTNFLEKYSLNSRNLKGLDIKHNLDDLTIKEFNFDGATLGKDNEAFSLANSKISNTNFKNVQLKGKQVDISGIEIDGKSFNGLLDSLEKCEEIKIYKPIKVTAVSKELRKKIIDSKLYKDNPNKFELTLAKSKKVASEQSKTTEKKSFSPLSFVQKLNEARQSTQKSPRKK